MSKKMHDDVTLSTSANPSPTTVSRSTWTAMDALAKADEAHGDRFYKGSLGEARSEVLRHLRKAVSALDGGGNECLLYSLAEALKGASRLR